MNKQRYATVARLIGVFLLIYTHVCHGQGASGKPDTSWYAKGIDSRYSMQIQSGLSAESKLNPMKGSELVEIFGTFGNVNSSMTLESADVFIEEVSEKSGLRKVGKAELRAIGIVGNDGNADYINFNELIRGTVTKSLTSGDGCKVARNEAAAPVSLTLTKNPSRLCLAFCLEERASGDQHYLHFGDAVIPVEIVFPQKKTASRLPDVTTPTPARNQVRTATKNEKAVPGGEWPTGSGYVTPPAHRPVMPHGTSLTTTDVVIRGKTGDSWDTTGRLEHILDFNTGEMKPLLVHPGASLTFQCKDKPLIELTDFNNDRCQLPYGITVRVDQFGQFVPVNYEPDGPRPISPSKINPVVEAPVAAAPQAQPAPPAPPDAFNKIQAGDTKAKVFEVLGKGSWVKSGPLEILLYPEGNVTLRDGYVLTTERVNRRPPSETNIPKGPATPVAQQGMRQSPGRRSGSASKHPLPQPKSEFFKAASLLLPSYEGNILGLNEVRIRNPNGFSVVAGLRYKSGLTYGKDFEIPANGVESVTVLSGRRYDIYFIYSNDPTSLYKGDSFQIRGLNGIEIQITAVANGNFGIRKVN